MSFTLHGLKKVTLIPNKHYKKSGTKSYAYLLSKWGFEPTMPGPYYQISQKLEEGKERATFHQHATKPSTQHILGKKKPHKPAPTGSEPAPTGSGDAGASQAGKVDGDDIQYDALYLCPVQIGSPAQTLNLDFDTGSADLWVWSKLLPRNVQSTAGHTLYDSSKSSTFKSNSSTWKISYGDSSSASGKVGIDDISIGGLVVKSQAVELASNLSAQFLQGSGDGLLGLAWGSINTVKPTPVQTPVENMISQKDIPATAELFTAKLGSWRDANEPDKGESFYTFGFIDQDTVTASGQQIAYTPIDNSQGFWQFDSTTASVNGKSVTLPSGNTAIADTGTTLALVSDALCTAVYGAIPGAQYDDQQQGWVYPENTTLANLPVVKVSVGSTQFIIQKEDLGFASTGDGNLYGGIQSRGSLDFDILGDTFLKNCYVIFDQGNKRLGAVQRPEQSQNISPPPQDGAQ